jgi:hypothetical protein
LTNNEHLQDEPKPIASKFKKIFEEEHDLLFLRSKKRNSLALTSH